MPKLSWRKFWWEALKSRHLWTLFPRKFTAIWYIYHQYQHCTSLTASTNQQTDTYPLPRIEDLFASLSGGKSFTKLDLAHAYQQIPLDEEAKEYTTINTHKGLYRYNHLPFGVASAPSIFQRTMENILQGLPHVCIYIDDILVTGSTTDEHLHNLEEVLTRLENANARLKIKKVNSCSLQ